MTKNISLDRALESFALPPSLLLQIGFVFFGVRKFKDEYNLVSFSKQEGKIGTQLFCDTYKVDARSQLKQIIAFRKALGLTSQLMTDFHLAINSVIELIIFEREETGIIPFVQENSFYLNKRFPPEQWKYRGTPDDDELHLYDQFTILQ